MDVSADLTELARTAVTVVCAGVKSILDIGRTLEVLETYGVTVMGFQTDEFPAFFTRRSGYAPSVRVEDATDVARVMTANRDLKLHSGMVVAVPVPARDEADGAMIQQAIEVALQEADQLHIAGKEITPFLLQRVNELTQGASLQTNIALIRNNARIGAAIAVAFAQRSAPASLTERLLTVLRSFRG
jgi:pseudouridine-5'-phosphate glycosidase